MDGFITIDLGGFIYHLRRKMVFGFGMRAMAGGGQKITFSHTHINSVRQQSKGVGCILMSKRSQCAFTNSLTEPGNENSIHDKIF